MTKFTGCAVILFAASVSWWIVLEGVYMSQDLMQSMRYRHQAMDREALAGVANAQFLPE